jgi:hypothetical protein
LDAEVLNESKGRYFVKVGKNLFMEKVMKDQEQKDDGRTKLKLAWTYVEKLSRHVLARIVVEMIMGG